MSEFHRRGDESEGRRGSRSDLEGGGRYLGIPQKSRSRAAPAGYHQPGVHEIGGGTLLDSGSHINGRDQLRAGFARAVRFLHGPRQARPAVESRCWTAMSHPGTFAPGGTCRITSWRHSPGNSLKFTRSRDLCETNSST